MKKDVTRDKREAILDAALELFAEKGYHAVSTAVISSRAGIGNGTLFRYFETKEALANQLYRRCMRAFAEQLLSDFDESSVPREQFFRLWASMVRFQRNSPLAFSFVESHGGKSYFDAESLDFEAQISERLDEWLLNLRERRVIKDLPPQAVKAIVFGTFLLLLREQKAGEFELDDDILSKVAVCCWEAIKA